jgi:putative Mn2+ efflux pump MntP
MLFSSKRKFMNLNKLFDLRFVIGSFFSIVGVLLLIYSFFIESPNAKNVNRWCGGLFLIFGMVMIILSLRKETGDDLPVEESLGDF